MYFFFSLDEIQQFVIFNQFNISLMSDFQRFCVLISVNVFYLLFLFFLLTIVYKTTNRLVNLFF